MYLLSCLLSLVTLLSARPTQPGTNRVNDHQNMEICREICRELRRPSIEVLLPSVLENLRMETSEQDALSNAQQQAVTTLNMLQGEDSTSLGFYHSQIWRGELAASIRKLMNDFKNRWYTIANGQQPTVNVDVFECNAHSRALDKGRNWLQKQHKEYDCPDCDELLSNEDSVNRHRTIK